MAIQGRGVKKIGENVLEQGRAIIVTDKNKDNYKWADIPNGSKFIDTKTGIESVKLEGESDWVPSGLKNDGTLCISRDAYIQIEIFTIIALTPTMITYTNTVGQIRHMQLTKDGLCVFELEMGEYQKQRNRIEVLLNQNAQLLTKTGDIVELTEKRFAINHNLKIGDKLIVKYIQCIRIGNPYPRVFYDNNEPPKAEIGDVWIDMDGDLGDNDILNDLTEVDKKLDWSRISGAPTTIAGYGIIDKLSYVGHLHHISDIIDFDPKLMGGGNITDASGKTIDINLLATKDELENNIKKHNTSNVAHSDIRQALMKKLDAADLDKYAMLKDLKLHESNNEAHKEAFKAHNNDPQAHIELKKSITSNYNSLMESLQAAQNNPTIMKNQAFNAQSNIDFNNIIKNGLYNLDLLSPTSPTTNKAQDTQSQNESTASSSQKQKPDRLNAPDIDYQNAIMFCVKGIDDGNGKSSIKQIIINSKLEISMRQSLDGGKTWESWTIMNKKTPNTYVPMAKFVPKENTSKNYLFQADDAETISYNYTKPGTYFLSDKGLGKDANKAKYVVLEVFNSNPSVKDYTKINITQRATSSNAILIRRNDISKCTADKIAWTNWTIMAATQK